MDIHVYHRPARRVRLDPREMVQVSVWPADKPTLIEKLAMQAFLASVKKLRNACDRPLD